MPPPHSAVWFPRLLSCWLSRGSTRHSVHSVVRQPYLDQIGWIRFSKMKPFHMMLLYKPKCLNIFTYFTKGLTSRVACTQMHCLMFYVGGNISSVIWLLKSWLFWEDLSCSIPETYCTYEYYIGSKKSFIYRKIQVCVQIS